MRELNYLLGYQNLKIYQDKTMFKFSLDSILLAHFVHPQLAYHRILDIGTGNAPIPLILSTKTKALIDGVEIQSAVYDLALATIKYNHLEDQISLYNMDIKDYAKGFDHEIYDCITCNPPYYDIDKKNLNKSKYQSTARHTLSLNLEDVMKISRKLLKNNGALYLIYKPDNLIDIMTLMRQNNIEPKRLKLIYSHQNDNVNLIMIEGHKNGKAGLKIEDSLYVHDETGEYSESALSYLKSEVQ